MSGAVLSARHSFMPNRLGYCGPDENDVLLEACIQNKPSKRLVKVLRGFHGAFPYLRFLAEHNKSDDPFDYRVTEAYWIGNDLLREIPPDAFYKHLLERFNKKFPREHVKKFFDNSPYASFPHHSLHVFNAFSTMGTVPDSFASGKGTDDQVGQLMDKCRISWGHVTGIEDDDLVVDYTPLVRAEGKLSLGDRKRAKVSRSVNGENFLPDVKLGDWVSVHWGQACTTISHAQVGNLERYTRASMSIANKLPVPG